MFHFRWGEIPSVYIRYMAQIVENVYDVVAYLLAHGRFFWYMFRDKEFHDCRESHFFV